MPPLAEMAEDPVSRDLVLLRYQAEKRRAEDANARLLAERARAERYTALLREMGIDVEA